MEPHEIYLLVFWIAGLVFAQSLTAFAVMISSRVERARGRWMLLGVIVLPLVGIAGTLTALAFVAYHQAYFAADWRGYTAIWLIAYLLSAIAIARAGWRRLRETDGNAPVRASTSWRVGWIAGVMVLSVVLAALAQILFDRAQQERLLAIVDTQRAILERDYEDTLARGPNVADRYASVFEELEEAFPDYSSDFAALLRIESLSTAIESTRAVALIPNSVYVRAVEVDELLSNDDLMDLTQLRTLFDDLADEAAYAGDLERVVRERETSSGLLRQLASTRFIFRGVSDSMRLGRDLKLLERLVAYSPSPQQVLAAWTLDEVTAEELLERGRSALLIESARYALFFASALLGETDTFDGDSDGDHQSPGAGIAGAISIGGLLRVARFVGGVEEIERLVRDGAADATHPALRDWPSAVREARRAKDAKPRAGEGFLSGFARLPWHGLVNSIGDGLASQAVSRAALAAVAYHLAEGRYPARLDDLVPRYLERVPEDPFRPGEPLGLAPTDAGLVIFSVGSSWSPDDGPPEHEAVLDAENDDIIGFALGDAYTRRQSEHDDLWRQNLEAAREAWSEELGESEGMDDEDPAAGPDGSAPDHEDP